ncbi:MAG: tetratricopeptide repeat protein [Gemmatimonadaceae bacterium]
MADLAKLKKKAAEFEASKKLDKAIATYREILDLYDTGDEGEVDVALYNRVGDLLIRQGDTAEAVTLYERAVDLYAEGGFFNNAIALCNKVLRTSPGRASVYYKLGKISAAKGFKGDAKQNFLEYADRMQKAGQKNEAFRALKEFADLCGDQDDIRLMLADQLLKADRKSEALEQLATLHERFSSSGQNAEAESTLERMRAIDPNVEVSTARKSREVKAADDLIFIDLDAPTPKKPRLSVVVPPIEPPSAPKEPEPAPSPARTAEPAPEPAPEPVLEPVVEPVLETIALEGIESTQLDTTPPSERRDTAAMLGLETTSLVPDEADESAPLTAGEFAELDLAGVTEMPAPVRASTRDLALPGELPLIDAATPDEPLFIDTGASPTSDLPMLDTAPSAKDELGLMDIVEEPAAAGAGADMDLPLLDVAEPAVHAETAPTAPPEEIGFIDLDAETVEAPTAQVDEPTDFDDVDVEIVEEPPPPVRRTTSMAIPMLAASVDDLREQVEKEPGNWTLRRQLAETMLDEGSRDEGFAMLEESMTGFERAGQLHEARSVAEELVRLNPASVRHHQKRVEFAFRVDDRTGLAQAYLDLANALFRDGHADKAKTVYQRVLEISPDDVHAMAALESLATSTPPVAEVAVEKKAPAAPAAPGRRYTGMISAIPEEPAPAAAPVAGGDDDYVSLGDWLREDEGPKNTRMVVDEQEPTGDENADFQDMLRKFKAGVAQNVEEEDHESHYDLGVAYKEMGLLDEAIAEFQKALRGTAKRARTYEALGQCFLEKGQLPVAFTILQRALHEPGIGDDQLVGVLYLLGYISEGLKKPAEAKAFYERVFAVDIQFRDIGERLNAVEGARA